MPTLTKEQLEETGTRIFVAAGVPSATARQVVQSLVLSNLLGVDSHGFVRIPQYLEAITAGTIVPDAQPEVVRDNGVALLIDGHNAFGQIVARRATELAIERAKKTAVCVVSFSGVLHIGRLGEYVSLAAEHGLIALLIVSGSRPGGLVSPFGSRQRLLGTNPIAFAIPAASYPPLVADFSTSAVAEGKVRVALFKGEAIPPDWVLDHDGKPTTNPADLYDGGAILPFGGHKGYSLSLLAEVLGGIVSGADVPSFPSYDRLQNGAFLLVVDQTFFRSAQEYYSSVDLLFTLVKQALPIDGADGVMIPGEPEQRTRAKRARDGITIDEKTWSDLREAAVRLNVTL
ncbi:MAG TPA: Ldh family oxidoreductase [Anaerolineae bacterium]|nr:Ldh family oxidoreductase [Anaerolineae bacterium]